MPLDRCDFETTPLVDGLLRHECRRCGAVRTSPTLGYVLQCTAGGQAPGWGDQVAATLEAVGITKERVTRWLGAPCHCSERRAKLNRLGRWAQAAAAGSWQQVRGEVEAAIAAPELQGSTRRADTSEQVAVPNGGDKEMTP